MSATTLEQVLAATDSYRMDNLRLAFYSGTDAQVSRRGRAFTPDALWRSTSSLTVYFKFEQNAPAESVIGQWRREVWNEGFAPLLWVISPQCVELYNGFGTPFEKGTRRNT